jgi:hypothetical protein
MSTRGTGSGTHQHTLVLGLEDQQRIKELIARAAARPLTRETVMSQIMIRRRAGRVALDPTRCVMVPEGYLVAFWLEDAPECGLARHLAVSCGTGLPNHSALLMLLREFGFVGRLSEQWNLAWLEPVSGRGRAVHLIEPVGVGEFGATINPDEIVPPSPDEIEEDDAE